MVSNQNRWNPDIDKVNLEDLSAIKEIGRFSWKHPSVTVNFSFPKLQSAIALRQTMSQLDRGQGLSERKFAAMSGMCRASVKKIELGDPSVSWAHVIAYIYWVSVAKDEILIPALARRAEKSDAALKAVETLKNICIKLKK